MSDPYPTSQQDDEIPVIAALRAQIRDTPLPPSRPRFFINPSHRRVPMIAGLGAAAIIAAVTLVVVLISGAARPPAAYAFTLHHDGTVTVTLRDEQDRAALNARLASAGIAVRVVPVIHGCNAPVKIIRGDHEPSTAAHTLQAAPLTFGVNGPHRRSLGALVSETVLIPIDPDRTFIIAESQGGQINVGRTIEGTPPTCVGDSPATTPAGWS